MDTRATVGQAPAHRGRGDFGNASGVVKGAPLEKLLSQSTQSVQVLCLAEVADSSPEHQAGIAINLSVGSGALPAPPAADADQRCDPGHDQR